MNSTRGLKVDTLAGHYERCNGNPLACEGCYERDAAEQCERCYAHVCGECCIEDEYGSVYCLDCRKEQAHEAMERYLDEAMDAIRKTVVYKPIVSREGGDTPAEGK